MSRWDADFSSAALCLAKEFAKKNTVFYFDYPFTLKDFIFQYTSKQIRIRRKALLFGCNYYRTIPGESENFIVITPRLVLPINWLNKGKLYNFCSGLNNRIVCNALRKLLRDFGIKEYIFFNSFNPFYFQHIPASIAPSKYVYQSRDDISEYEYISKHGVTLERKLTQQADVVMATSKNLVKKLSAHTSNNVLHLPNAVNFDSFHIQSMPDTERPTELANAKNHVIGFIGNLDNRVNFKLLLKIAKAHTNMTLLIIGPQGIGFDHEIGHELQKMDNVVFTGPKNIKDLPQYLQYVSCAIIPFEINGFTKSIYPLKINEYLAAGRPVVSTSFSEDIRDFEDLIYLATDDDHFIKSITRAIEEDDEVRIENRIRVAQQNSWPARAETFWQFLEGNG